MRIIPTRTVSVLSHMGCSNYDSKFSNPLSEQIKFKENAGKHLYRTYCVNPVLIFVRDSIVTAQ